MLIFWNLAGVPLSYCHCTIYLANHSPSVYHWNRFALVALYVTYLFTYWVWDTANSQKNRFRQHESGNLITRKTFPQLPWQTVKDPKTIPTDTGDSLLVDGWCKSRRTAKSCELRTDTLQTVKLAKYTTPVISYSPLVGASSPALKALYHGFTPSSSLP